MTTEFERTLLGWRLTTIEIVYHMPDHPSLLQEFILQQYDLAPKFPALTKFLAFWDKHIEGQPHSVRFAARGLIAPTELKLVGSEFRLH